METDNSKIYSYQEVSLHNTAKDCWIIINAKVLLDLSYILYQIQTDYIWVGFRQNYITIRLICRHTTLQVSWMIIQEVEMCCWNLQVQFLYKYSWQQETRKIHYNRKILIFTSKSDHKLFSGNDASEEFEAVGHGSAARLMLDEYYVGEIDQSTKPTSMAAAPAAAEAVHTFIPSSKMAENVNNGGTPSSVSIIMKLLPFLMPLLILGFAAMIGFFSRISSTA